MLEPMSAPVPKESPKFASDWSIPDLDGRRMALMDLAQQLFPIHRTLVNRGFDQSLEILQQHLPLTIDGYRSGTAVWDWVIPNAWDVNEAWIERLDGERLVDFRDSNIHLSAYSVPFDGVVTHEDLLKHVAIHPDLPDAIPYNYLYYNRDWQFNVTHHQFARFTDDHYRVRIDIDERPGELKVGSYRLPGETDDEFIISTYLCHPSMANDNLSGVLVATELMRQLSRLPRRRQTWRLLILPETIGVLTWLSHNEELLPRIRGAYTVYNCGDSGPITYKQSWFPGADVDVAAAHVLRHYPTLGGEARVIPWHPSGSDERQFNAPGVRIAGGSFMRTPPGEFAEYHTSLDTLDILDPDALLDSVQTLFRICRVHDENRILAPTYRGEPCFSRHEIEYPSYYDDRGDESKMLVKKLIYELDGRRSLLEIADRWNEPLHRVVDIVRSFERAGLAREVLGTESVVEPKPMRGHQGVSP